MIPTHNLNLLPSRRRMVDIIDYYGLKLKMERVEGQVVESGKSLTVFSKTGAGVVTSLWFAAAIKELILRVYYEGETDPSLEFDFAGLGVHFASGGQFSTENMTVGAAAAWNCMGVIGFPLPYGSGIKIDVYNPAMGDHGVFIQAFYTDQLTMPFRLKGHCVTYSDRITVTKPSTPTLLDITGMGWLVYNSVAIDGLTSDSYMKADVEVYVDGEASPSIKSTGWEDWFLSGWYFADGNKFNASPFCFCSLRDTTEYRTAAAIDILAAWGGIRFLDSLQVKLDYTEGAIGSDCELAYCFLWYERV